MQSKPYIIISATNNEGYTTAIQRRNYSTTVRRSVDYVVEELICELACDGQTNLIPVETRKVRVDDSKVSSGKTKHMYRVSLMFIALKYAC